MEQLERLRLAAEATNPLDKNIRLGSDVVVEANPTRFAMHGLTVLAGAGGGLITGVVVFVALWRFGGPAVVPVVQVHRARARN